jgi:hypothetical protein
MRSILPTVVVLIALVAIALTPRTAYEGKAITILFSGDTYGELESCG